MSNLEVWHVTIHNNDGQIVDYTNYKALSESNILFPEVLKSQADFTLKSGDISIWIYDNSGTFDKDLAVRFARYLKSLKGKS